MRILLDTNFVLRLSHPQNPQHAQAKTAFETLSLRDAEMCLVPQVLYEFWVVATRPTANNGLGLTIIDVDAIISRWLALFRLLLDERGVFTHWRELVKVHAVLGKQAHDARLVAAMQRHGLTNLLTFNKADFARFAMIQVYTPEDVLAGQVPA